jgi:ankyrin repeat protein
MDLGKHPILLRPSGQGHCAVVKVLLAHGARPDQVSQHGSTPLLEAARHGRLDCVIALLEAGASPDKAGGFGWRPVHYAVAHLAVLEQRRSQQRCQRIRTANQTPIPIL